MIKMYYIVGCFQAVFLPQGYPESVSKDYLEYQIWDTVQVSYIFKSIHYELIFLSPQSQWFLCIFTEQAFSSSITGTLATQAVLQGVGVGDETASVLAATVTWILKG